MEVYVEVYSHLMWNCFSKKSVAACASVWTPFSWLLHGTWESVGVVGCLGKQWPDWEKQRKVRCHLFSRLIGSQQVSPRILCRSSAWTRPSSPRLMFFTILYLQTKQQQKQVFIYLIIFSSTVSRFQKHVRYHIPDESSYSSWMTSPQLKIMSSVLAMLLSTMTLYLPATWTGIQNKETRKIKIELSLNSSDGS